VGACALELKLLCRQVIGRFASHWSE
jgi:hypothetical protein